MWSLCLSYPLRSWHKLLWQVQAAEILHFPSSKGSLLSLCKFVVACIGSKFCLFWKYVFDQSCNVYVIVKIVSLNVVYAFVLQMCVFILLRNHVQERVLLLLLSSSSSLSPLCRVFIHIFLRQTLSLGNRVFQLFFHYSLWCLYR